MRDRSIVRGGAAGLLGVVLLLSGGPGGPGEPTGERARFPGSTGSLAELGEAVLDALTAADTLALRRVLLTEVEHNEVVWPELPASRPEVGFPVDLAWRNIQMRNRRELGRILPWYRGRRLDVARVECRGGLEEFRTFAVHTDCWVVFRTEGDLLMEARIFKDVLVREGGYKIFRYYDGAPRASTAP